MIKTEIINSLTEKYQVVAPAVLQNENPNSESNISSANKEKISKPKVSTENEHHRSNSSLLGKKITRIEKENDEKGKAKLKNNVVKKTLILGDSIVKNVDG